MPTSTVHSSHNPGVGPINPLYSQRSEDLEFLGQIHVANLAPEPLKHSFAYVYVEMMDMQMMETCIVLKKYRSRAFDWGVGEGR